MATPYDPNQLYTPPKKAQQFVQGGGFNLGNVGGSGGPSPGTLWSAAGTGSRSDPFASNGYLLGQPPGDPNVSYSPTQGRQQFGNPNAMFQQLGGSVSGQPGQSLAQGLGVLPSGPGGSKPLQPWEQGGSSGTPNPWTSMLGSGGGPTMPPQTGVTMSGGQPPNAPGTFSAQSNLINSQFSPTPSDRLTQFRGTADNAVNQYAGLGSQQNIDALRQGMQTGLTSAQGAQSFQYQPLNLSSGLGIAMPQSSGVASGLQKNVLEDLEKVRSGTDRAKLAADAFALANERSLPEFNQRVRQLGQNTAALGRIGSGIYGSNLTDLNTEREQAQSLASRELANQAAGQSLADRLDILGATKGVAGDVAAQDAARYSSYLGGMGDAYNRARDERDFQFDVARYNNDLGFRRGGFEQDTARGIFGSEGEFDDRRFGQSRTRAGDLSDYARGIEGSERADRDELRGERDYQYGLSRDAENDRYRQRGFEEDLVDRAYDRDIRGRTLESGLFGDQFDRAVRAYEVGGRNNVPGQLNAQAQRYDQQSQDAGDAFAELMASYGLRNQPTGSPSEEYYRRTGAYPVDALPVIPRPQVRLTGAR